MNKPRRPIHGLLFCALLGGFSLHCPADNVWDGSQNNNWDNSPNWHHNNGETGWPRNGDTVTFRGDEANRSDVDLRFRTIAISEVEFLIDHTRDFSFKDGKLQISSGILNRGNRHHVFDIDIEQVQNGDWVAGKTISGQSGSITINGVLSGSGGIDVGVHETAPGVLILNSANPYSGLLRVQNGAIVRFGHVDALQNAVVDLQASTTLDLTTHGTGAKLVALTGTGNVDLGSTSLTFNNPTSYRYDGALSGSGAVVKNGAGNYTLGGANSHTGVTAVTAGQLILAHVDALQNSTAWLAGGRLKLNVNNTVIGSLLGTSNVDLGSRTTRVGNNNSSTTYSGVISGASGTLVKIGTGELSLRGANTYGTGTRIEAGSINITADAHLGASSATLTFANGAQLTTDSSLTIERDLAFADGTTGGEIHTQSNDVILNGALSGATTNTLEKRGSGSLRFNTSSPFSGKIDIIGGTVIPSGEALATAAIKISSHLGLDVLTDGGTTSVGTLQGGSDFEVGNQALLIGGNSLSRTYTGVMSGNGVITKTGTGTQTFAGLNSYSGRIDVDGGSIRVNNAFGLQHATVRIQTTNGFKINGLTAVLGALAGSGTIDLSMQDLTVGANNSNRNFSGQIKGEGGVRKEGTGNWSLNGSNTYDGATTIADGSLAGSGSVAGDLLVLAGGTLNPGNSTGTFATGSNAVLDGVYRCEIDGATNDTLVVAGDLDLTGSTLDIDLLAGGVTEEVYIIATYGTRTGTFASILDLPAGYAIDYNYDDGISSNNIAIWTDLTPPTITLNGPANLVLDFGQAWSDPSATAIDLVDGPVPVTVGGDVVSSTVPGISLLTYDAIDAAGNAAAQVTRTVTVRTAYQSWSLTRGLTPGLDDAPFDDPDGDGCPNIKEFAIDGDPLSGVDDGKTRAALVDLGGINYLTLTIPIRAGALFQGSPSLSAEQDGVNYQIEATADLQGYESVVSEIQPAESTGLPALSAGWAYRTFKISEPISLMPRAFLRAGVSPSPP